MDPEVLGTRTRLLDRSFGSELTAIGFDDPTRFNEIIKLALKKKAGKKDTDDADKADDDSNGALLSYLLFISPAELASLRAVIASHAEPLRMLASKKKLKASDIPESLKTAICDSLSSLKAVDIALFGRMLTDRPEANQHAACQVAHAISTHRVEREFDYFTAVEDLRRDGETGAPMISHTEFVSATFYRYAVVDVHKLAANLQGDAALALQGLLAFAEGLARALPTGKRNAFGNNNPPSFVGVVLRHGSPMNLANAFEKPVTPKPQQALTALSVTALSACERQLAAFYGDERDRWGVLDATGAWPAELGTHHGSLAALLQWLRDQVQPMLPAAAPAAPAEA